MGHERVGFLPKTDKWRTLVRQIAGAHRSDEQVADLATKTAQLVRSRLRRVERDTGVQSAFSFLVGLALAAHSEAAQRPTARSPLSVDLWSNPTPVALAKLLRSHVVEQRQSLEYAEMAEAAAADAIATWYAANKPSQQTLFSSHPDSIEAWRRLSSGAGFCELARLYFARFTERYLNYFLERAASTAVQRIHERDEFQGRLRNHLDRLSRHAFETARITQSFAAGWFNKHAAQGTFDSEVVQGFLAVAFGKIRDELLRAAEAR